MTPGEFTDLKQRVTRLEAALRDADAHNKRQAEELRAEHASLVDAIKRHTDASNRAQIQPVMLRLAQVEETLARMTALAQEDRELKERMRIALSDFALEKRIEREARDLAAYAAKHRLTTIKVIVPILVALLGLVSAAVASHYGIHP